MLIPRFKAGSETLINSVVMPKEKNSFLWENREDLIFRGFNIDSIETCLKANLVETMISTLKIIRRDSSVLDKMDDRTINLKLSPPHPSLRSAYFKLTLGSGYMEKSTADGSLRPTLYLYYSPSNAKEKISYPIIHGGYSRKENRMKSNIKTSWNNHAIYELYQKIESFDLFDTISSNLNKILIDNV